MVVRDKQAYLTEANRQLKGERFYNKLDFDPTEEFWALITDTLEETYKSGEIGVNVHETLNPTTVDGMNFICFQISTRKKCLDSPFS